MRRIGAIVTILLALLGALPLVQAEESPLPALSKPPKLLHFVEAQAPPALFTRGSAEVVLLIDIDEKGAVTAVKVDKPAGDGFDEAAVAAARQFVFSPGEADGKPVPVRITYRSHFLLKPQQAAPVPGPDGAATTPAGAAPTSPPLPGAESGAAAGVAPGAPAGAVPGAAAGVAPGAPAGPPTGPMIGTVLRKGDRVPLPGVVVVLDADAQETVTDTAGHFAFDALPLGAHTIHLRGTGLTPADATIKINPNKRLDATFYVAAKERYMSTVRAEKATVETVEQTLSLDEIKRIPGTQGDLLKAVQNLPGVARAPFGLGLLIVWGSAPQDTRTYVDGVYIPTLYHFGGLRSTVNSEIVQDLSFSPGGYGAERGLGLGGIIDIDTRRPRSDGYHGFVQLDLIDGSILVEGPITKKLSFAVALRRSWIDVFLPIFTRNSSFQLSPVYYDYQAKLSYRPTSSDDLNLFIFGSDDQLTVGTNDQDPSLNTQFGSHTYYHRLLGSWLHRFKNGATYSMVASAGIDVPYQVQTVTASSISSIDAHLGSYTLRAIARLPVTSFLRVDVGLDYEGNYFTLDQTSTAAAIGAGGALGTGRGPNSLDLYTNHLAPLVSANFSFFDHKLTLTPQLRVQLLSFLGYPGTTYEFSSVFVAADPRFQIRYQILPWFALKAAFGMYHQPPQPESFSTLNGNPSLQPEWGLHYVLGVEFRPFAKLNISAEGFYKDMRSLVVSGEYANDPLLTNDGIGRVYGGEVLARLELWHNLFGWISYTLSRSERQDHPDQDWHLFEFDQTHILTIIASYKLPRGFQVGIRFRYVTGNPYTPATSAFFDSVSARYVPIQGQMYSARLSSFNQLDVRLDKTWTFNRWSLSIYLDVQNIYDAANPEIALYNFNYQQQYTINGLPILPVFGIRGDF
jgi:TonB family protein